MSKPIKIANAQAFWGDRNDAASELVAQVPDLDYLTLDYLAEVSLSILAQQQVRDPNAGYARDFLEVFKSLIPYWQSGGRCKLITNAGGLNPEACAQACVDLLGKAGGTNLTIAVVSGDAVLDQLRDLNHPDAAEQFRHLESGEPIATVRDRLVTANAYLGAAPIVDALAKGADIVITGRVADPSLTVAPCVHHFGWAADDWDRWAAATVAGHLIECGVQVTGGISTDWLTVPKPDSLGFPVVEMNQDGTFIVTKPEGSGGRVTLNTVAEQLVYEIGDPGRYLSPDLTVSFLGLRLQQIGQDRVLVTGAQGSPPSSTYKVSETYRDGYRAAGLLTIFGRDAVKKAERCGQIVLDRIRAAGLKWRDAIVEVIGAGACASGVLADRSSEDLNEVAFRVALEADDQNVVEFFTRQIIPLVTSGPQGTTGYAEGRPRVHPIFRYWPCLIDRQKVIPRVQVLARQSRIVSALSEESTVCRSIEENGPELLRIADVIDREKAVDKKLVFEAIEQAILSAACKYYGESVTIEVHVDRVSGNPTVKIDGEDVDADALGHLLGRISAQTAKQVMLQKIREAKEASEREPPQATIDETASNGPTETARKHLGDIAIARSGDKGTTANIGVISRRAEDYAALKNWLTPERVAKYFAPLRITGVQRFEMPNLHALNFLVHGVLSRGLRCDAQGKALGQVLLEMPLDPELDDDNE